MTPSPLEKQTASQSPHGWLMRSVMDIAILCDVELKLMPIDVIWLFSVFMESLPAI